MPQAPSTRLQLFFPGFKNTLTSPGYTAQQRLVNPLKPSFWIVALFIFGPRPTSGNSVQNWLFFVIKITGFHKYQSPECLFWAPPKTQPSSSPRSHSCTLENEQRQIWAHESATDSHRIQRDFHTSASPFSSPSITWSLMMSPLWKLSIERSSVTKLRSAIT